MRVKIRPLWDGNQVLEVVEVVVPPLKSDHCGMETDNI